MIYVAVSRTRFQLVKSITLLLPNWKWVVHYLLEIQVNRHYGSLCESPLLI